MSDLAAPAVPDLLCPREGRGLAPLSAARLTTFEELYAVHFRDLSGYCAALLGDEHLGVDCAQEAFTRLFGRFRTVRNPRAWLFLVATNLVRDEWRTRARHRTALAELRVHSEPSVGLVDTSVLDVVRRLPSPWTEVVLLHYFADLPLDEVARVTRRPLGTVKRRLHEARRRLEEMLGEDT